jgi:hypothetical protein
MKNNKGSYKNRIKSFYTTPEKFGRNRIKEDQESLDPLRDEGQGDDQNFKNPEEQGGLS